MTKPRPSLVGDVPLRRRAKAGPIKVLLAVVSGRERVAAPKTGLSVGGELLGTMTNAGTLGRTPPVTGGRSMKEVPRLHGKKDAKTRKTKKVDRSDAEGCHNKNVQIETTQLLFDVMLCLLGKGIRPWESRPSTSRFVHAQKRINQ